MEKLYNVMAAHITRRYLLTIHELFIQQKDAIRRSSYYMKNPALNLWDSGITLLQ